MLPDYISGAISTWLRELLFGAGDAQGEALASEFSVRKLAHFLEFASLGGMLTWLLGMLGKNMWVFPLGLGVAAALVDETIQGFVPGRAPRLFDLGVDTLGVCLGILLVHLMVFLHRRKRI